MSVNSHLSNTASGLVLSEAEKNSIATSISTLKSRAESWFGSNIAEQFKFGSYNRDTILPRKVDAKSDIDYMMVFKVDSDGQKKPQTYLDRLRKFAEGKYATSEIYQSNPTIVLSLNHINFELVPAIKSYFSYQIPSPASSWQEWITTNPASAEQAIVEKNKNNNYQIKPLVRLIKYWNASQGYPFSSFYLEQSIVGMSFFLCTNLKDYFYAFWSSFSCPYDASQSAKDKVARAKKCASDAKSYESKDMPVTAENEIKKIIPEL